MRDIGRSSLPDRVRALIGKLYIVALIAFAVWYGKFMYPVIFSHERAKPAVEEEALSPILKETEGTSFEEKALLRFQREQRATETTDLGYTVVKEQYVKGHFHHIGMTVESDESNVCVRCHGAVPHDKSKALRAFLNMHAFYLACETCHIQPKQAGTNWVFRWYDKSDGKETANPPGLVAPEKEMYGNYGAKLAPGLVGADGMFRFLNGERERRFVAKYINSRDVLSSTERSKMKKVIHRRVDERPLLCERCHTKGEQPYLPFAQLGYPPRRIAQLTDSEVVGMVKKYRAFYIPNFLVPGEGSSVGHQGDKAREKKAGTESLGAK